MNLLQQYAFMYRAMFITVALIIIACLGLAVWESTFIGPTQHGWMVDGMLDAWR